MTWQITSYRPKPYDLILWLVLAGFAIGFSRYSSFDWATSSIFFDPASDSFRLRNEPFWATLHTVTRQFSIVLWALLLFFTVRTARRGHHHERVVAGTFILLASAVALAVNGLLKTSSVHSCPWSLVGFGGTAEFFRLLDPVPLNPGNGGCFPSGHAAVGFMWWSVVYACVQWKPSWTYRAITAVLAFGIFCGYLQVVRGAHFVSHILMTAAVTGGCTSLVFHTCIRMSFWREPVKKLI